MAYYSITFGDKNTWADWHLIPATPPMVSPPSPVTKYVDIPGRKQGPLDMTEWFGGPSYGSSSGSWDFISEYDAFTHDQLYEQVRRHLHNKSMFIKLEEDPSHYYKGRFSVSLPKTGKGPNTITINYVIEPVRYNARTRRRSTRITHEGGGRMYVFKAKNAADSVWTTIYDSSDRALCLIAHPRRSSELNQDGSFDFTIYPGSSFYDAVVPMDTFISAFEGSDAEHLEETFYGRVLTCEEDFYGMKSVSCEGALSFLKDATVGRVGQKKDDSGREYMDSPQNFLQEQLTAYNARVEDRKKLFYGGTSGITTTDIQIFKIDDDQDFRSLLESQLIDVLGGFFKISRRQDGTHELSYVKNYGIDVGTAQTIQIGQNILDKQKHTTGEGVFTFIRPVGKDGVRLDDGIYHGVTCDSSNGCSWSGLYPVGTDAASFNALYARYGFIERKKSFDDCETSDALANSCSKYVRDYGLDSIGKLPVTFDVKLVDFFNANPSVKRIELGANYILTVDSEGRETGFAGHADGAPLQAGQEGLTLTVYSVDRDYENPDNDSLTFYNATFLTAKDYSVILSSMTGSSSGSSRGGSRSGLSGVIAAKSSEEQKQFKQFDSVATEVRSKTRTFIQWQDPRETEPHGQDDLIVGDIWVKTNDKRNWQDAGQSAWIDSAGYKWDDYRGNEQYVWRGSGRGWELINSQKDAVVNAARFEVERDRIWAVVDDNDNRLRAEMEMTSSRFYQKYTDDINNVSSEIAQTASTVRLSVGRIETLEGGVIDIKGSNLWQQRENLSLINGSMYVDKSGVLHIREGSGMVVDRRKDGSLTSFGIYDSDTLTAGTMVEKITGDSSNKAIGVKLGTFVDGYLDAGTVVSKITGSTSVTMGTYINNQLDAGTMVEKITGDSSNKSAAVKMGTYINGKLDAGTMVEKITGDSSNKAIGVKLGTFVDGYLDAGTVVSKITGSTSVTMGTYINNQLDAGTMVEKITGDSSNKSAAVKMGTYINGKLDAGTMVEKITGDSSNKAIGVKLGTFVDGYLDAGTVVSKITGSTSVTMGTYINNQLDAGTMVEKITGDSSNKSAAVKMGTYINGKLDAGTMVEKITGDSSNKAIGVKLGTFVDGYLDAGTVVSKITGSTSVTMGTYINNQLDAGTMVEKITGDSSNKAIGVKLGTFVDGYLDAGTVVSKITGSTSVTMGTYINNQLDAGTMVEKITGDSSNKSAAVKMGTYINGKLDAGTMVEKITGDSSNKAIGVKLGTFVDGYLDAGTVVSKITGSTSVTMGTYINNQLDAGTMVEKITGDSSNKSAAVKMGTYINGKLDAGTMVEKITGDSSNKAIGVKLGTFVDGYLDAGTVVSKITGSTSVTMGTYINNQLDAGTMVEKITGDSSNKSAAVKMGTYINGKLDAGTMVEKITGDSSNKAIGVKLGTFVDGYLDAGTVVSKITGSTSVTMGTYINNQLDAGTMVEKITGDSSNKSVAVKMGAYINGALDAGVMVETINSTSSAKASLGFYDSGTLTAGVIVNKINGGATTVAKIKADKINLEGLVTAKELATQKGRIDNLVAGKTQATKLWATDVAANNITIGSENSGTATYRGKTLTSAWLLNSDGTKKYPVLTLDGLNDSVSTGYKALGKAIYSFGTATSNDGKITIPTTKIDGTTGPSINFNIADTRYYKDSVSAAEDTARKNVFTSAISDINGIRDNGKTGDDFKVFAEMTATHSYYYIDDDGETKTGEFNPKNTNTVSSVDVTSIYKAGWGGVTAQIVDDSDTEQSGDITVSAGDPITLYPAKKVGDVTTKDTTKAITISAAEGDSGSISSSNISMANSKEINIYTSDPGNSYTNLGQLGTYVSQCENNSWITFRATCNGGVDYKYYKIHVNRPRQ